MRLRDNFIIEGNLTINTLSNAVSNNYTALFIENGVVTKKTLGNIIGYNLSDVLTSIGYDLPSIFNPGSPITPLNSNVKFTLVNQPINTFFAAPAIGTGTPSFRKITASDLVGTGVLFEETDPKGVKGIAFTGTTTKTLTITLNDNTTQSATFSDIDTTYASGTLTLLNSGTDTVSRVWSSKDLADYVKSKATLDTITRLRGTATGTYTSGDLTLLVGSALSLTQATTNFTFDLTTAIKSDIANGVTAFGWGDHAGLYALSTHTHTTANVNLLTGYVIGTNAILAPSDTLNSALGKLQAQINSKTSSTGTVTSVAMTVPTGLSIAGSPITTSGTLALTLSVGYSIPTTIKQTNWDTSFGWGDFRDFGLGEIGSNRFNDFNLLTSQPTQFFTGDLETGNANSPDGIRYGGGIHISRSTAVESQLYFGGYGTLVSQRGMYFRNKINSTEWTAWSEVFHTGNLSLLDTRFDARYLSLNGGRLTDNSNILFNSTNNESAIFGTGDATAAYGYGIWIGNNINWDGSKFTQPRGTLGTFAFTANNHKGFSFNYSGAVGTNGATLTLDEVVNINRVGLITTKSHGDSSQWNQAYLSMGGYVKKIGDTMSGPLIINPSTSSSVIEQDVLILQDGGTASGNIIPIAYQFGTSTIPTAYMKVVAKGLSGVSGGTFQFFDNTTVHTIIDSVGITANQFIKAGGTATQFLKANGTVDSNSYALTLHNHDTEYLSLNWNKPSTVVSYGTGTSLNLLPLGSYIASLSTTVTEKPFNQVGGLISFGSSGVNSTTKILGSRIDEDNLWFQNGASTGTWRQIATREWVNQTTSLGRNKIHKSTAPDAGDITFVQTLMSSGFPLFDDPEFKIGLNGLVVYGSSTVERVDDTLLSSNSSGKLIKITNTVANNHGFFQTFTSRPNSTYVQIFRAKIPIGYGVYLYENQSGTGKDSGWLTSTDGTGKWEWYVRYNVAGITGTFSSVGHVGLIVTTGAPISATNKVEWFLSYCNGFDLTQNQNTSLSAKRLFTQRTLWGQAFDGSSNVVGDMSNVGNVDMSGKLTLNDPTTATRPIVMFSGLDSIESNHNGVAPTNTKLALLNGVSYGTLFYTLGNGSGMIQQQRIDGQNIAYPLHLNPKGGIVVIGEVFKNYAESVFRTYGKIETFGRENNNVTLFADSTTSGSIVSGTEYKWYDRIWRIGNRRNTSSGSLGLSIEINGVETARFQTDGVLFIPNFGTSSQWYQSFLWGDHKSNGTNQYLGATYSNSGIKKPSDIGSGKLKLEMLNGSLFNGYSGGTWIDALWLSSYTGSDVKKSSVLLFDKYTDSIGFAKQNYDAETWGDFREIYHTGNLRPFNIDTKQVPTLDTLFDNGFYRAEGVVGSYSYSTTLNMNSIDGRSQLIIDRDGKGMMFRSSKYNNGADWTSWNSVKTGLTKQLTTTINSGSYAKISICQISINLRAVITVISNWNNSNASGGNLVKEYSFNTSASGAFHSSSVRSLSSNGNTSNAYKLQDLYVEDGYVKTNLYGLSGAGALGNSVTVIIDYYLLNKRDAAVINASITTELFPYTLGTVVKDVDQAFIDGSNTTGGTWKINDIQSAKLLTAVGNGQIFQSNGSTLYLSNPEVKQLIIETSQSNIFHYIKGVGNQPIWTAHNFDPNSKANTSGNYQGLTVGNSTLWNGQKYLHADSFVTPVYIHVLDSNDGTVKPMNPGSFGNWVRKDILKVNSPTLVANSGSEFGIIQNPSTTDNPTNNGAWWNKLKVQHSNSSGYFTELAMPFTIGLGLYYRTMEDGSLSDWRKLWSSTDFGQSHINKWEKASADIGNLSNLITFNKITLVDAINETQRNVGTQKMATIVDLIGLDETKFYPIVIDGLYTSHRRTKIRIFRPLNPAYGTPTYSTHGSGMSTYLEYEENGGAWGGYQVEQIINRHTEHFTSKLVYGKLTQITEASLAVIYVRGGSKHEVEVDSYYSDRVITITLHPTGFYWESGIYNRTMPVISESDVNPDLMERTFLKRSGDEMFGTLHIKGNTLTFNDHSIKNEASYGLYLNNSYGSSLMIHNNGNVGINTINPQGKLTINANSGTTVINDAGTLLSNATLALVSGGSYGMNFANMSSGYGVIQQQRFDGNPTAYPLELNPKGGRIIINSNYILQDKIALEIFGSQLTRGIEGDSYVREFADKNALNVIQSGHEYKWYNTVWKVGNRRGNSSNSLGYSIEYNGNELFSINTVGKITGKNLNFTQLTTGNVGIVNDTNALYTLQPTYAYGISVNNASGGMDIMANQSGSPIRFWSGGTNAAPYKTAEANGANFNVYGEINTSSHLSSGYWYTAYLWGNHAAAGYTLQAGSKGGNSVLCADTRGLNPLPNTDLRTGVWFDFKANTTIGLPLSGIYSSVITFVPYQDSSGNNNIAYRLAQGGSRMSFQTASGNTWSPWKSLLDSGAQNTVDTNFRIKGQYANAVFDFLGFYGNFLQVGSTDGNFEAVRLDTGYGSFVIDDEGVYYNRNGRRFLATLIDFNIYTRLNVSDIIKTTSALEANRIELYAALPFIDFHFGNSTSDYTSRIIEETSGRLSLYASNGIKIDSNINGLYVNSPGSFSDNPIGNTSTSEFIQRVTGNAGVKHSVSVYRTDLNFPNNILRTYGASMMVQSGDTIFNLSVDPFTDIALLSSGTLANSVAWARRLAFTENSVGISAPSFTNTSLRKYKTNITTFNGNALDLIDSLNIVIFDRIDTKQENVIGVIADDTKEEFLSEDKDGVDLYQTLFIQAKAIQELKKEIELLKEIIQNK